MVDPAVRRAFLDERRRSHERRMDEIHAPAYDAHWGEIFQTHAAFVARFLALVRPGGTVLDVPCGTGKYWPTVLESGRTVVGFDQSAGMLEVARAKLPHVPTGKLGLQELPFEAAIRSCPARCSTASGTTSIRRPGKSRAGSRLRASRS